MRDLFTMWRDTRMVVLVAVLAALHAAAVIPFKPIQILPGVTDLRPGMVLPIVFSLLFGPPAAWAAAFGNTISDLFGTLGPGSFFGFVGNLVYGYVPWRIWSAWSAGPPTFRRAADWILYGAVVAAASGSCALVIGWGVHLLDLYPFGSTAGIIAIQNMLVGAILGPPLIGALQPRVARLNIHSQERPSPSLPRRIAGVTFLAVVTAGLASGFGAHAAGMSDAALGATVAPFVAAALVIAALL